MSLSSLPPEVWIRILGFCSRDDVRRIVSLVSGELNRYANVVLYQSIEWAWERLAIERIIRLLTNLMRYPELGTFVQRIRIRRSDTTFTNTDWTPPRPARHWAYRTPPEYRDFSQQARSLIFGMDLPDATRWVEEISYGNPYVCVALILGLCPNVQAMVLDYSFVYMGGWPGRLITAAFRTAPRSRTHEIPKFGRLRELEYGLNVPDVWHANPQGPFYPSAHPDQFDGLFRLEALQHLAVWLRHPPSLEGTLNIERLETLCLVRSTIAEQDVEQILRRASRVHTLHLGLIYHRARFQPFRAAGTPILDGLMAVRNTVHILSIGIEYEAMTYGPRFNQVDSTNWGHFRGFLLRFPHLISVELPVQMLLGLVSLTHGRRPSLGPLLPPSLLQLIIRLDLCHSQGSDEVEPLWGRLSALNSVENHLRTELDLTPQLKFVTLRSWQWHGYHTNDTLPVRTALWQQYRVRLEEQFDRMSPGTVTSVFLI
ncbi:uncharacterized protein BO97DRAFT_383228 [Aspergillus homomorphus CBS 101889]|uniref:F-box domain-containing protein n=1 Tax=Aspergillus homomorphus (strain CBS 101889) TaxID=1450537 RepID=A0A395I8I7_ASPHC|nr:hypothetical protein BO97DRAFT_383228 [Aspergillus homomorphus CBS 101889]RAL16580.1 hypothetical protein BO97DRAFT_383228 [Aspergillus homomorphus CBS 101889]